jgi:hypothetical protein
MFKETMKSFARTVGKIFGYIFLGIMTVLGVILFLDKSNFFKRTKKGLKIYVRNPEQNNDNAKGEQLEDDINLLNSDS